MFTAVKMPYDHVRYVAGVFPEYNYNMPNRQNALHKWLSQTLDSTSFSLTPLAGDASFRRYHRLHYGEISRIIMDAPPDREATAPFIAVAELLRSHGLNTPRIHAMDTVQGFLMLDDFGDRVFLNSLSSTNTNELYQSAIDTLITLQGISLPCSIDLPLFDKRHCLNELGLCEQWFLRAWLGLDLSDNECEIIKTTFDELSDAVLAQPLVVIHRDYHSRNLMLTGTACELGVIDFQDAMIGPYTYDLASLLKDCYIQWPPAQLDRWLRYYYERSPLAQASSYEAFVQAFHLCGLQRHLKVLGVFSRLFLRDNKPGYLKDLPLTLHYVLSALETCGQWPAFYDLMRTRVRLP